MGNVSKIVKHLKTERDKVEKQLSALNLALSAFVGSYYGAKPAKPVRKKRCQQQVGRESRRLNGHDGLGLRRRRRRRSDSLRIVKEATANQR
jgi:hypothetical protein